MTAVAVVVAAGAAALLVVWLRARRRAAAAAATAERHRALLSHLPSAAALDLEEDLRRRMVEGEGRAQFLAAAIERIPESVLVCDRSIRRPRRSTGSSRSGSAI